MRVEFTKDYDYRPKPRVLVAYKAGMVLTVKKECADAAIASGKAHEVQNTKVDDDQRR